MQQIGQRLFLGEKKCCADYGNLKDLGTSVLKMRICALEEMYLFLQLPWFNGVD